MIRDRLKELISLTIKAQGIGTILHEASSLHRQGRLSDANRLYRTILDSDGGNFDALLNLGIILLQQGRLDESVELTRRALQHNANSAEAHCNLATALEVMKQHDEAISEYESALVIDPGRAEAHYGLASALHAVARHDQALIFYRKALALDPDYAEASCGCAGTLQAMKRYEEAIGFYQKALDVDPEYAEAGYGCGTALQALKRDESAIGYYERAISAKPDFIEAQIGLANALLALDRHEEAIARYKTAITIAPRCAQAIADLGTVLEQIGQGDEARQAFEKAAAIAPSEPRFRFQLINSKRIDPADTHFAALRELSRNVASLTIDKQMLVHFGLGKAYSDIGDARRSLEYFLQGNALKRGQIIYDEPAMLAMFNRTRVIFSQELIQAQPRAGNPSSVPVFILGMPRSGSTLIEQILASHPQVHGAGEVTDFVEAIKCHGADSPSRPFPESIAALTGEQIRHIGDTYLARISDGVSGFSRITDKTPGNFLFLGLIHMALPNARIIHTRRNAVDTCVSCFSRLFADDQQPFTYDLGELGRYYRAYTAMMQHWDDVVPQNMVLDVDYEALVADFEPQARRIVSYCGLEWNDACLSFHEIARPVKTASVSQVRQPIYRSSVGRWRSVSDDLLRPLLDALNGI